MNIIFVETNIWKQVRVVSENKLLHHVTIGIYHNQERATLNNYKVWTYAFRLQESPYNYLVKMNQNKNSHIKIFNIENCSIDQDTILWNSSFIFDETLVENLEENTILISEDSVWIAMKTSIITQELLNKLTQENSSNLSMKIQKIESIIPIRSYSDIIQGIQKTLHKDIKLFLQHHPEFTEIFPNVFVHPQANIRQPVDFDTEQGIIVIGSQTKITAFTLVEGPAFIGDECLITRAFIRPYTSIGNYCRVAGELSLTTMTSYSNKSHDGCIALSYIGSWVNLGAGTECATLKYTYTPLNFKIETESISTNMIGCGTIFGEWVSTGVGTILSPATLISLGSVLHQPHQVIPKYNREFSWNQDLWNIDKWLQTAELRMKRKNRNFCEFSSLFYKELFYKKYGKW